MGSGLVGLHGVLDITWVMFTIGFLLGDLFNMDVPPLSVDCLDLAFSALEDSSDDLDGISLADWNGPHIVLSFQFLIQVGAHNLPSQV